MLETLKLASQVTGHHWKVFRKHLFSNVSVTISDPVFFTLAFGFGLGAYVSDIDGRSYIAYMAPGLAAGSALITSFFESSYAVYIRLNFGGTYKGMLTSPIGVREVVLGEIMWVALKGAGMATSISIVFGILGYVDWKFLVLMPLSGGMIGISCGSIGLLSTTFVKNMDQFQLIYSMLIAPIYFLSGIFYPINESLGFIYYLVQISPLYHGVRMAQSFLWNENILEIMSYHFPILVVQAILLALWATHRFSKRLFLI